MYFKWAMGTCLSIPDAWQWPDRAVDLPRPFFPIKHGRHIFSRTDFCLANLGPWFMLDYEGTYGFDIWIWFIRFILSINPLKLGCFFAVDFGGVYPWGQCKSWRARTARMNLDCLMGFASPILRCRFLILSYESKGTLRMPPGQERRPY